jgi:hypothetical protein
LPGCNVGVGPFRSQIGYDRERSGFRTAARHLI